MAVFLFQFTLPKKDQESLPEGYTAGYIYCKYNSDTKCSTGFIPKFQKLAIDAEFTDDRDPLDKLLADYYLVGIAVKDENGNWIK